MKRHEAITSELLKQLGFTENGEYWDHPYLGPKNLLLIHFDLGYHFVLRQCKYQGIGTMKSISDLEVGFNFVTGYDLFTLLYDQKI